MLRFSGAGVTDVGPVRDHNEDSAFVGPYLALVADGVGGAAAGEIASATAAYTVTDYVSGHLTGDLTEILRAACARAQTLLLAASLRNWDRSGMATTLTAVATDGARCALAHVGDSRAYLIHGGRLVQLSTDHTYVQQLVDDGYLDADRVRTHPWKHVVLRALPGTAPDGGPDGVVGGGVDVLELQVEAGDRLLLCSDGLTDVIADAGLVEAMLVKDPQSAAAVLVEQALAAGGADNVTCVVLDVIDGPRVVAAGTFLGAVRDPVNIVNRSADQEA